MLSITIRLGLANKIWFNLWNQVGEFDNLEMVPQDLFNRHFGRYTMTNPHGIQIEYDMTCCPSTDEERAKVIEWDHPIKYDLETERENQWWEWRYGPIELPRYLSIPIPLEVFPQPKVQRALDGNWGQTTFGDDGWNIDGASSSWSGLEKL